MIKDLELALKIIIVVLLIDPYDGSLYNEHCLFVILIRRSSVDKASVKQIARY